MSNDAKTLSKLETIYANLSKCLENGPALANVNNLPLAMRESVQNIVKAASNYPVPRPDNCGPKQMNRPWLPSAPNVLNNTASPGVLKRANHETTISGSLASYLDRPTLNSEASSELADKSFERFCDTRHVHKSNLYNHVPQLKSSLGSSEEEKCHAAFETMLKEPTSETVPNVESMCFEKSWNRIDDVPKSPKMLQGPEMRNWVLSAKKALGLKVVAIMFAGRRNRMKLAVGYTLPNLKVNGGIIDELLLLKNTPVKLDIEYIDCLGSSLKDSGVTVKLMRHGFASAFQTLSDDTIYVKIDDDTVYIAPGSFESLFFYVCHAQFAEELSKYDLEISGIHNHVRNFSGFTANSVNNPPLGWLHERLGYWRSWTRNMYYNGSRYTRHHQVATSPEISFALNHAAFIEEWCSSHRTFGDTLLGKGGSDRYYVYDVNACECQSGGLADHQSMCYRGIYKTILNFYAFAGKEINKVKGEWSNMIKVLQAEHVSGSDESIMTMAIPRALGKSVGLVPTAIVSHLAKLKQNNLPEQFVVKTIDAYHDIMEVELQGLINHSDNGGKDTACANI